MGRRRGREAGGGGPLGRVGGPGMGSRGRWGRSWGGGEGVPEAGEWGDRGWGRGWSGRGLVAGVRAGERRRDRKGKREKITDGRR
ncbi:hypothetical protein TIFTF001_033287 [Ficus carica]|uniref:Uncharacterized protein n=1 Tax=Ficus carica TaxID=3494 RepID=A0AA88J6X3_FICCA|nr:hypothetical protein TIFTF001_033287 [Ficus carica]